MSVYVDNARIPYRGMIMCHMLADTLEELHAMAQFIDLEPEWFQNHGMPHYDICLAKRHLAVRAGAIQIGRRDVGALIRRWRAQQSKNQ